MKYGETSKILTVYSQRFGKIKVIAKGARKAGNKFGSSLQPMTHASLVFYKKENRDLHLLSKSETVVPFHRLLTDMEKIYSGLAMIEVVNAIIHDEQEDAPLFRLLVSALNCVNTAERSPVNVVIAFLLKVFSHFGIGITLESCGSCRKKIDTVKGSLVHIRLSDGTITCQECVQESGAAGIPSTLGMVKTLKKIAEQPLQDSFLYSLSKKSMDDIISILYQYLQYHFDGVRTLKTLPLLYSVGNN
jgi:DNA repair protein RecO (recombination protein O)